jgi:translation initiation factor 2 subunit 3
LKEGDIIEIRPGRITEEQNKTVAKPIITKIISLMTGTEKVTTVKPGGSVAVLTELDPGVVKSDALAGSLVGYKEKLPDVLNELTLDVKLLDRVVGSKEELKVDPLKPNEIFMLTVNSAATVGRIKDISKNKIICSLKKPVCASKGDRVTMSRRVGTRFRLIGYGIIN